METVEQERGEWRCRWREQSKREESGGVGGESRARERTVEVEVETAEQERGQ